MSMQTLLVASQSMSRMQTMQSARTRMQGSAKKEEKADALDEKSNRLMGQLMGEMTDINEVLKPDEEARAEEKETEKELEKNAETGEKTDTVTLSDYANGYRGPLPKIDLSMGEAVTYEPDGSESQELLARASSTFEAMA